MLSSNASQTLILQLQTLAPYWPDASVFLEYTEAGMLNDVQIQELSKCILSAEYSEIEKNSLQIAQNTSLILSKLREQERIERSQEEQILHFWF